MCLHCTALASIWRQITDVILHQPTESCDVQSLWSTFYLKLEWHFQTLCDIIVVTTFNIWRQNAVKIMNFELTPSEAPPPPHFNVGFRNFARTTSQRHYTSTLNPPISMLDFEILLAQRRKGIMRWIFNDFGSNSDHVRSPHTNYTSTLKKGGGEGRAGECPWHLKVTSSNTQKSNSKKVVTTNYFAECSHRIQYIYKTENNKQ